MIPVTRSAGMKLTQRQRMLFPARMPGEVSRNTPNSGRLKEEEGKIRKKYQSLILDRPRKGLY